MKSTISSKGQIVLPVELRRQDGIQPGQTFEIERIEHGEYRLVLTEPPRNQGLVDALLACPERDWFQPIPSESTLSIEPWWIIRRAASASGPPARPGAPARRRRPR